MAKVLIALLIIACIAPLFIKGPDGKPIMSLDDWKIELPASLDDLFSSTATSVPTTAGSGPTKVYKWQDEDGQWHFSNTPPPDVAAAEEMELDGDINIMEAYVPPEDSEPSAQTNLNPSMPTGPMTASPDQIKEMMDTVTNLQETIDQRKADMDEIAQPSG